MWQTWRDLLFAHWPVKPDQLRPLIPEPLQLDTVERDAWLAITPFHMDMGLRGLPFPRQHFPELNCRTYVSFQGRPGVFFFSLDAGSRLAVWGARTFYRLPYFHSRMTVRMEGENISYSSRRSGSGATLTASYRADSEVRRSLPGTLENWLTERYCLYTYFRDHVYRGEIHHVPWPLQDASCEFQENRIATAAGIELPDLPPLAHFAAELDVLIWPLKRVN